MFIISLTYKNLNDLSEVDKYKEQHLAFVKKFFDAGIFICSGRKIPRSGGVILANGVNKEQLNQILSEDPLHQHQLIDFDIIEFNISSYQQNFSFEDVFKTQN